MVDEKYWAKKYIKKFRTIPNIIEVANLKDEEIINQIKLFESWM